MSEVQEKAAFDSRFADIEINRLFKNSPALLVPALKEDEVAVYKLIAADIKDLSRRDDNNNPIPGKPGRKLHHTVKVNDPVTRKQYNIRNITGYTIETLPGGQERDKPKLERFLFRPGGATMVKADQQETYAWLERHNGNRDNPFRDKTRPAVFYRVNPKRTAIKELENDYILVDALNYVRDASLTQLKTMYSKLAKTIKLDINADSAETLKRGLFEYTKNNPILAMKAGDDRQTRLKIQIMEAEYFNIIMFDEGDDEVKGAKRQWRFVDKKMTPICEVELATPKIDGLIEYFEATEEAKGVYLGIVNTLNNVLNPKK